MYYLPGIGIGFALLAALLVIGRFVGQRDFGSARIGMQRAALAFLPIWLLCVRPGFSSKDDGQYVLVELVVPAAVALTIWWTLRPRTARS